MVKAEPKTQNRTIDEFLRRSVGRLNTVKEEKMKKCRVTNKKNWGAKPQSQCDACRGPRSGWGIRKRQKAKKCKQRGQKEGTRRVKRGVKKIWEPEKSKLAGQHSQRAAAQIIQMKKNPNRSIKYRKKKAAPGEER